MLLAYEWPEESGDPPERGTMVDVSGDPDCPVLRGVVGPHQPSDESGITAMLPIIMGDGQNGAEEFQVWVSEGGSVGIMVAVIEPSPPGISRL